MGKKVYTHNFEHKYAAMQAEGLWNFEITEKMIELFESQAAELLKGAKRKDVGAVMLYYKNKQEIAYFDYENFVGSVYALGGTSASFMPS
jgi:hypothetical protein